MMCYEQLLLVIGGVSLQCKVLSMRVKMHKWEINIPQCSWITHKYSLIQYCMYNDKCEGEVWVSVLHPTSELFLNWYDVYCIKWQLKI